LKEITPEIWGRASAGSGGSPEPGPLNSGVIILQKYFYTYEIYQKLEIWGKAQRESAWRPKSNWGN